MSQENSDPRTDRILDVALELAERDGYDAVRLRQVAERADVALGTVYRRFASKEDILAAVLAREVGRLREALPMLRIEGDDPESRLESFLGIATRSMTSRPKLSSAMFRTVASGVPELSEKVSRYYGSMAEIFLVVMYGEDAEVSEDQAVVAKLIQSVWFAALVGWTGGMHGPEQVVSLTTTAAKLMLAGQRAS
jgi:AcrR family transcriptional regulator